MIATAILRLDAARWGGPSTSSARAQLRRIVLEANGKNMRTRDARKKFGIGHEMW
jgi:hypothetical protein